MFESSLAELNINNNDDVTIVDSQTNNSVVVAPKAIDDRVPEFVTFSNDDEQPNMVANTVYVDNFQWKVTDPQESIKTITKDLLKVLHNSANVGPRMKAFSYLQGNMKVLINVQGFSPAMGRLVMFCFPTRVDVPDQPIFDYRTIQNCRILPHVIIDPSKTASYSITVPLFSPGGVASPRDVGSWGLAACVYDSLGSGTDVSNDISVFVRVSLEETSFVGKTLPLGLFEKELAEKPSTIMKNASKVLSFAAPAVPAYTPFLTLGSKITGTLGDVLAYFGYSKPQVVEYAHSKLVTSDNYTQLDGVSKATVLGRSQIMHNSIDPRLIQGDFKDQELSHLLSKPIRIATYELHHNVGEGFLFSIDVQPDYLGGFNDSLPSVLSNIHGSWSGTMRYRIEIPASVFHRATILVAYMPGPGAPPTYANALAYLDTCTVVVSGNTSTLIEIPWRQPTVTQPFDHVRHSNGQLIFYLLDTLVSNGSEDPVNIDVIGDWSGVNFHFPFKKPYFKPAVEPLGDWIDETFVSFGTQSVDHISSIGGDATRTIKDLTSRMSLVVRGTAPSGTGASFFSGKAGYDMPLNGEVYYAYIFRSMFLGYRGSLRASVFGEKLEKSFAYSSYGDDFPISYVPGPGAQQVNTYYGITYDNLDVVSTSDVVVPWMGRGFFTPGYYPESSYSMGKLTYRLYADYSDDPTFDLLLGSGDDAVFAFYLGVPIQDNE